MGDFRVTCISHPHPTRRHEHITHIGNIASDWRMTVEAAIVQIDTQRDTFYTLDPQTNQRSNIRVVRDSGKSPFLRAQTEGQWNDLLLALPECSTHCELLA